MRNIVKGAEPKSLEEYRCSTGATYDDYQDKPGLRESLVVEQRGLCCYCLSRISADPQKMKIEHWHSQAQFPEHQLHYSNLLGACHGGGVGKPPKLQHCDTRKGNQAISLNPANIEHDVEHSLRYNNDGTICSTDPIFDCEINDVLNLNLPLLKITGKRSSGDLFKKSPDVMIGMIPSSKNSSQHGMVRQITAI
jgi:uncharacterized protein (TIGR02646 family)